MHLAQFHVKLVYLIKKDSKAPYSKFCEKTHSKENKQNYNGKTTPNGPCDYHITRIGSKEDNKGQVYNY